LDVVYAGLGPDPDLLELLLVGLLVRLLGLGVLELAVVHDLAHRGPLGGGHLDQVQPGLAGHLQGLRGGDDPVLLAVGADEADGGDADLLGHPRPGGGAGGVAVERWDCRSSFLWERDTPAAVARPARHPAAGPTRSVGPGRPGRSLNFICLTPRRGVVNAGGTS